MHLSLYRRHRPRIFSEVVAQEAAVGLLRKEIGGGRNSHAYLFSGPRGCGKTTLARIVAKALNCPNRKEDGEPCSVCPVCDSIASGEDLDVVEIDGASNRGIDEIRELKEHVSLSPFSGKFKVYIIDEVHMLTDAAFNALLKTLEEPPNTVVFILATTEPHKVPSTIRSRCQHIPFHRIPVSYIVDCLSRVSSMEGGTIDNEALWEMARESDGSLRDALSLLEQALSTGLPSVSLEDIRCLLGGGGRNDLQRLIPLFRTGSAEGMKAIGALLEKGLNSERLLEGLFLIFRDLLVTVLWGEEGIGSLPLSADEARFVREESANWSEQELWRIMDFCSRTLPRARFGLKAEVAQGMLMGLFAKADDGVITAKDRASKLVPAENRPEPAVDSTPAVNEQVRHSSGLEHLAPAPEKTGGADLPGWERCLDLMSADYLPLYCACVSSIAREDGDRVTVFFPEDSRYCFEMATTPRNLSSLDEIRKACFPDKKMMILCGERSIEVEGTAAEAPASYSGVDVAPEVPFRGKPETSRKRSSGSDMPAPGGKIGASESRKDSLSEIQRCFNADLLVLREDETEDAESSEGAAAE